MKPGHTKTNCPFTNSENARSTEQVIAAELSGSDSDFERETLHNTGHEEGNEESYVKNPF